jgi:L-rhamnose mutarotase
MDTETIAFRMYLHPGQAQEYRRRHEQIWPELVVLLKDAGIVRYRIYLDEPRLVLLAVLERRVGHTMDALPTHPVMRRWWHHMRDIMKTEPDGTPVAEPLPCMFELENHG